MLLTIRRWTLQFDFIQSIVSPDLPTDAKQTVTRLFSTHQFIGALCAARYLKKGIASLVSEEPPTIRLDFQHAAVDQQRGTDAFYSQSKANRCVACGEVRAWLQRRV